MKWTLSVKSIILIQLIFISHCANSLINLFISKPEMQRTLGLDVQLNYIENGIINLYSAKFPYRINANISSVYFSWYTNILNRSVHYMIRVVSHDNNVIPLLQIPPKGNVPLKTETFSIEYRCAGIKTGVFDIQVNFNFNWPSNLNETKVSLKHEKLCLAQTLRDDTYSESIIWMENSFYVLMGCLGAIAAILILVYFRSIEKSTSSSFISEPFQVCIQESQKSTKKRSTNSPDVYALMPKNIPKGVNYADEPSEICSSCAFMRTPSISSLIISEKSQITDFKKAEKKLYADRSLFEILPTKELEGTFGEMKWAMWKKKGVAVNLIDDLNVEKNYEWFKQRIIVKQLKFTADQKYFRKFLQEALQFFDIKQHENLAQVIAIASCNHFDNWEKQIDFPLICYSHNGFGNLKKFLINFRNGLLKNSNNEGIKTLRVQELVSIAVQILNALIHLHNFGIIHKDIATRNCLITKIHDDDQLFVQICDSALSEDFFPDDYHYLGNNENRPVKWMANESLIHNLFNSSTDVWSFGVTLWELFTCAQQPYPEIDPDKMVTFLEYGKRLSQPYSCPDDLYELMHCCWQIDYCDRPTAQQLLITLQKFNQQLLQYI